MAGDFSTKYPLVHQKLTLTLIFTHQLPMRVIWGSVFCPKTLQHANQSQEMKTPTFWLAGNSWAKETNNLWWDKKTNTGHRPFDYQHVPAYFITLCRTMWPRDSWNISALQNATALPCDLVITVPLGELTVTFTIFLAGFTHKIGDYYIFLNSRW